MATSNNIRLKLISFESIEKRGEQVDIQVNKFNIHDFNLLIGDNAQGKSRLFRMLSYFSSLYSDTPRLIPTTLNSSFIFELFQDNSTTGKVLYDISIHPVNGKNIFSELVMLNDTLIFSTKDKYLFNERKNEKVINFFIPDNLPALRSINESDYKTIKLLREFFQRIMLVSPNKLREIEINPNSMIPNDTGTNISYVLLNWQKKYTSIFNEIMNDFKECYYFINKVFFEQHPLKPTGQIIDVMMLKEDNVYFNIEQTMWSDGIYRLLWLLMLPKIPFNIDEMTMPPSLVLIDEIENGLDFKTIKYIIQYLNEYSDDCQIIMSSHSPLICDFIHPNNWIVVKRDGTNLNFISPSEVENNIDQQLDLFKQKHWEFYIKHISNSNLYDIK